MSGRMLAGRYELASVLGRGGMGEVWVAQDTRIQRNVAVKLLQHQTGADDSAELFLREARTAGGLTHQGIVTIHDLGQEDGTLYLVMELLVGRDLSALLREDGPPPIEAAVEWCAQVSDALAVAHTAGIIHRDLKPANLMLTSSGTVKILDFGIARYTSTVTQASRIIGTPHYMPPERLLGKAGDGRGDLYSLGCLMHELLTGATPFTDSDTAALMFAHVQRAPEPPSSLRPDIPAPLDQLVLELLAKSPDDRPATAVEVRDRLRSLGPSAALPASMYTPTAVIGSPAVLGGGLPDRSPAGPSAEAPASPSLLDGLPIDVAADELGRMPRKAAFAELRRATQGRAVSLLQLASPDLVMDALPSLDPEVRQAALQLLDPRMVAAVLDRMSPHADHVADALNSLSLPHAVDVIARMNRREVVNAVGRLNPDLAAEVVDLLQPAEIAALTFEGATQETAAAVLERTGPAQAALLLGRLDPSCSGGAVGDMDEDLAVATLNRSAPSGVASVLAYMDPERAMAILPRLRPQLAEHALGGLGQARAGDLLESMDPARAAVLLGRLGPQSCADLARWLGPRYTHVFPVPRRPGRG